MMADLADELTDKIAQLCADADHKRSAHREMMADLAADLADEIAQLCADADTK